MWISKSNWPDIKFNILIKYSNTMYKVNGMHVRDIKVL